MKLLAIQREIIGHLVTGSCTIEDAVKGDATARLAVYHNAYRMQLLGYMGDTYEKTKGWLGDAEFDSAALRHIEAHVPSSWTLDGYAADFVATLDEAYPRDREVAELAWLDWTLRRAFDGPDALSLTGADLAGVNWETAILHFVPTLRFRSISTNSPAIWAALAEGVRPPSVTLLPSPGGLRVWREKLAPRFRSMDALEQQALSLGLSGATFAGVCAELCNRADETEALSMAAAYLGSWIADGLIAEVRAA